MAGCRRDDRRAPPPDAQRPTIKSEEELAAERTERIQAGQVVPTSAPFIESVDRVNPPPRRLPPPPAPAPGAIQADLLMVNDSMLTVAEVLLPLWPEIEQIRSMQTPVGFRERVRQLIRRETQRSVGSLLIFAEAMGSLTEEQRGAVEARTDKEVEGIIAQDYGGSAARLSAFLSECGLSVEQYRGLVQRELVVRQYSREKLMPQIQIRRDELVGAYRRERARFQTAETRELLMIELPFEKFLSEERPWETATRSDRAAARLAAQRAARAAHEALAERPFEDVAREFDRGSHGERGGSWGPIGRPLQAPYDQVSGLIFGYTEGQFSEPTETETGWYIVKCGPIAPATERSFADVQDELRGELMERRFARLSTDYVLKLAEKATVSSLDLFVAAALQRAEQSPVRIADGD